MSVRFSVCDCVPAGVEKWPEETDRNIGIHSKRGDPHPEDTGEVQGTPSASFQAGKGRAVPLSSHSEERTWERGPGLQRGRGYRKREEELYRTGGVQALWRPVVGYCDSMVLVLCVSSLSAFVP